MRRAVGMGLAILVTLAGLVSRASAADVTDDQVRRAIEMAKEHLVSIQKPDGTWPEADYHRGIVNGHTAMALLTLAYIGEHPNRGSVSKGLDAVLRTPPNNTYTCSLQIMALAQVKNRLAGDRRKEVTQALRQRVAWLIQHQRSFGGWPYISNDPNASYFDFSNTQIAILALWEAALAGEEIPDIVWARAQKLYFSLQRRDGGWNYGRYFGHGGDHASYGSMTAAGLASVYICWDQLNPGDGCPCKNGRSTRKADETGRRVDAALKWLSQHFTVNNNPLYGGNDASKHRLYWLYSAERVGIAAGYKFFGEHDWFGEGAGALIREQQGGSWGEVPETAFATMFLYKGMAPILYNKLLFDGQWNNHRRDIASLTHYISRTKEQLFLWQIVELKQTVDELHEAPILFITAETVPAFSDADKKKLREFTDTGGTILFEASCGNPEVREWFRTFIEEVWPEWKLMPLGSEHGSFVDPYHLAERPEILGLTDGLRTFLFYAMDDVSCAWHTKAYASKQYLFNWGINLVTYATDRGRLRSKLQEREAPPEEKYTKAPLRAGSRGQVTIFRLEHSGDWGAGRRYFGWRRIVETLREKTGLEVSVIDDGTAPTDLQPRDVAYLGGTKAWTLEDAQRQALGRYLKQGGFLFVEAVGGNLAFDQAWRKVAGEMGLALKNLQPTDPILTGTLPGGAVGYDLSEGVRFSRALRIARLGRPHAELIGIYDGATLVGLYSPFDLLFSATCYTAYGCRGYQTDDARAVAANVILFLTGRKG